MGSPGPLSIVLGAFAVVILIWFVFIRSDGQDTVIAGITVAQATPGEVDVTVDYGYGGPRGAIWITAKPAVGGDEPNLFAAGVVTAENGYNSVTIPIKIDVERFKQTMQYTDAIDVVMLSRQGQIVGERRFPYEHVWKKS
ncbi:MAG TPA: hypothetical protein VFK80_02675 [Limnochordia bacterium]|nr:hypothetical protein [Limnochordia bacterium]